MTARALSLAALALALAGCGPTIKDICNDLEACPDHVGTDCVHDGETLEDMADSRDCDDEFSDYLDCLDRAGCDWRTTCDEGRERVSNCVGELPD